MTRPGPELRNISFLCTFFTSSVSGWEQHKSGNPLDHSPNCDRFSFHTDEEEAPFLSIRLPSDVPVDSVSIRLRSQYSDRIMPLEISARATGDVLRVFGEITSPEPFEQTVEIGQNVSEIRIAKRLYGFLYLAGVDVLVSMDAFDALVKSIDDQSAMAIVHAPFYGLGGALAACASSTGAIERSKDKKLVVDKPMDALLAYPPAFTRDAETEAFVRDSIGPAPASTLFADEKRYKSKRGIAMWIEDGSAGAQDRPVRLITRDNAVFYKNKDEHEYRASQRLYQRLVPSEPVIDRLKTIMDQTGLRPEHFERALGVHIRHGNGERYYSTRTKKWGVKPPPLNRIAEGISAALEEPGIERLIVCCDSPAIEAALKDRFPDLEVTFISSEVQAIGAGCSHIEFVFDPAQPRKNTTRAEDDIVSFAEILCLSKCARLCGGQSYFYYAVIGFSDVAPEYVFHIDNSDRYTTVHPDARPLLEYGASEADTVTLALRRKDHRLDGLFLRVEELEGDDVSDAQTLVTLSFFGEDLLCGSTDDLCAGIARGELVDALRELRLYP